MIYNVGDKVWCASYRDSELTNGREKFTVPILAEITCQIFNLPVPENWDHGQLSYLILYEDEFGPDEDSYGGNELFLTKEECEQWIKEKNKHE